MAATLLLVTAVITGLACLHPLLIYPLSLAVFAKRRPDVWQGEFTGPLPSVAILMSAYNEEKVIVAKVCSLIAMKDLYGPASIHIYVDGATDRTAELLRPYADVIDLLVSTERRGKTFGLNLLVDRSSSDLMMFTDANVENDANALLDLARSFEDPEVGCASARLEYTNRSESPTSAIGASYWALEEQLKRVESRTVGLVGVDGAMFLMRRDLYKPAPPHLIDDLYTSLSVLIQRYRVVSVDGVIVKERSAIRSTEEYARKKRIACQAMNVHKMLWPDLRRLPPLHLYAYISHRLIKWLAPFFALVSFSCGLAFLIMMFGWATTITPILIILVSLYIAGRFRFRIAGFPISVLLSLTGVGVGVLQSWFTRKTYTVWSPAASVRYTLEKRPVEQ